MVVKLSLYAELTPEQMNELESKEHLTDKFPILWEQMVYYDLIDGEDVAEVNEKEALYGLLS